MTLVSGINSSFQNFFSGFKVNNPAVIIKRTMAVSIPIFTFLGLSNLPTANAGVDSYAECIANCLANGGNPVICPIVCTPFLLF